MVKNSKAVDPELLTFRQRAVHDAREWIEQDRQATYNSSAGRVVSKLSKMVSLIDAEIKTQHESITDRTKDDDKRKVYRLILGLSRIAGDCERLRGEADTLKQQIKIDQNELQKVRRAGESFLEELKKACPHLAEAVEGKKKP